MVEHMCSLAQPPGEKTAVNTPRWLIRRCRGIFVQMSDEIRGGRVDTEAPAAVRPALLLLTGFFSAQQIMWLRRHLLVRPPSSLSSISQSHTRTGSQNTTIFCDAQRVDIYIFFIFSRKTIEFIQLNLNWKNATQYFLFFHLYVLPTVLGLRRL